MFCLHLTSGGLLTEEQQHRLNRLTLRRPDAVSVLNGWAALTELPERVLVVSPPSRDELQQLRAWGGTWHVFLPHGRLDEALQFLMAGAEGVIGSFDAMMDFFEDEQTLEAAIRLDLGSLQTLTALFDDVDTQAGVDWSEHLARLCELLEVDFVALLGTEFGLELAFSAEAAPSGWPGQIRLLPTQGSPFSASGVPELSTSGREAAARPTSANPLGVSAPTSERDPNETLRRLTAHALALEDIRVEHCPGPLHGQPRLVAGRLKHSIHPPNTVATLLPVAARLLGQQLQRSWLLSRVLNAKREWEGTVDTIPDPICLLDSDGNILRANQALASLVRQDVKRVVGLNAPALLMLPPDSSLIADAWAHARATDPAFRAPVSQPGAGVPGRAGNTDDELVLPVAPDRRFRVMTYALPVNREEGLRQDVLVYLRDITEERRLLAIVTQQERFAAFGELAEMLFHDFGGPIGALQTEIYNLKSMLPDIKGLLDRPSSKSTRDQLSRELADMTDCVAKAYECTTRLSQMSTTLQQYRSFGAQQGQDRRWVDLSSMLHTLPRLYQGLARHRRVEIRAEIQPLPLVLGNGQELMRVLENLIKNALEAQKAGGEILLQSQTLSDVDAQEQVLIRVSDRGPGVPAQVLPFIFERGFTTRLAEGGTGIGLYLCRQIVQQHGGTIRVDNRADGGTSFTIVLPATPPE